MIKTTKMKILVKWSFRIMTMTHLRITNIEEGQAKEHIGTKFSDKNNEDEDTSTNILWNNDNG